VRTRRTVTRRPRQHYAIARDPRLTDAGRNDDGGGLYSYLRGREIVYEYEPRVLRADLAERAVPPGVIEERKGTCIDLAALFAACLGSVHRDPLIVIVKTGTGPGHRTTCSTRWFGCWQGESASDEAVIFDRDRLLQAWTRMRS